MKIINHNPIFDLVNHGFVYLCQADDGTYWVRSVGGKWAQVKTSLPVDTATIAADFDAFQLLGQPVTENDVKIDNSGQTVVDPIKAGAPVPAPEPALEDPII